MKEWLFQSGSSFKLNLADLDFIHVEMRQGERVNLYAGVSHV